ncbi:hypothetical protein [Streptomyces sp. NPDC060002]|uniref:hypothetical protein n=1 Tax=Streptomyces sp. NPDC060002 TaxID=3347033 RepID=UPI0036CC901D
MAVFEGSEPVPDPGEVGEAVGRDDLALYLADSDRYEDSLMPTGSPTGTPADALDRPCRLHLAAPGT